MIGTHPYSSLAPLDYRCALDAALAMLASEAPLTARCDEPALTAELSQRLLVQSAGSPTTGAVWVEPQVGQWQADLGALIMSLAPNGRLAIIVSLPMARLLPERRNWSSRPLGLTPGGLAALRASLRRSGMWVAATHGFHGPAAIVLSQAAAIAARLGRPDLGDRLGFTARRYYRSTGPLALLATVALVSAIRIS